MIILSLNDFCTNSSVLKVIMFLYGVLKAVTFIVPIILIIMVSIDFSKNVVTSNDGEMGKNLKVAGLRFLMAILVFFVVPIINFSVNLLDNNDVDFAKCILNATKEKIEYYKSLEDEEKVKELENRKKTETPDISTSNPYSNATTGNSLDASLPKGVENEYVPEPKTSDLKLYKNRTLRGVSGPGKGNAEKIQQFAITDIGTENEIIWYSFETRTASNSDRASHILAYNKSDKVVYAAYLKYGGEGQSFDVVKKSNNIYTIYTGANGGGGLPKNSYKYDVTPSEKYETNYDTLDLKNEGIKIGYSHEISVDQNMVAIMKSGCSNLKIYNYNESNKFQMSNLSLKNTLSLTHCNNGHDLNGNYVYHVNGGDPFTLTCYNINTQKKVYSVKLTNVMNKVRSICKECPSNGWGEVEGIKVYTYKGKKRVFIGFRAGGFKYSPILYFDY